MNIRGEPDGEYIIDPDFVNGDLRSLTVRPVYTSRLLNRADHTPAVILPEIARALVERTALSLRQSRNPQFQNSYSRARGYIFVLL
jgi:hypothetical protein